MVKMMFPLNSKKLEKITFVIFKTPSVFVSFTFPVVV